MCKKYPSWCCQKCGHTIGYFGRALQYVFGCFFAIDCHNKPRNLEKYESN
jgi:hypothetical protein